MQDIPLGTLQQLLLLLDVEQRLFVRLTCQELSVTAAGAVEALHPDATGRLDPRAWQVFYRASHLCISRLRKEDRAIIRRAARSIRDAGSRVQRLSVDATRLPQHDTILLLQVDGARVLASCQREGWWCVVLAPPACLLLGPTGGFGSSTAHAAPGDA